MAIFRLGRHRAAWGVLQETLTLCNRLADRQGIARCLNLLGMLAWAKGDIEGSCRLHRESLALARQEGDWWGMAWALHRLGASLLVQVEAGQTDLQSTETVVREGLGIWRDLDERRHLAFSTTDLGVAMGLQGNFEQAHLCMDGGLSTFTELDDDRGVLWTLTMYARVIAIEGHAERAVCLLNAVFALAKRKLQLDALAVVAPFRDCFERYQLSARAAFGADIVAQAVSEGQSMSLEQAMAYARNQSS